MSRTCTYSLIIWGCRKSFRFWISRLILPTTSRLRIFCLFRIFTATLCPVNWCSPTNGKKALQSHYAEKQDTYRRFKILRWMIYNQKKAINIRNWGVLSIVWISGVYFPHLSYRYCFYISWILFYAVKVDSNTQECSRFTGSKMMHHFIQCPNYKCRNECTMYKWLQNQIGVICTREIPMDILNVGIWEKE